MAFQGTKCKICIGCGRCTQQMEYTVLTRQGRDNMPRGAFGVPFVAADIGTTTIAMEYYDGEGKRTDTYATLNPQRTFGADVISRIQAAENPMNLRQMKALVRKLLWQGLEAFKAKGEVPERMILAGNTTMVYLLMGYDPSLLGRAPFTVEHPETIHTVIEGIPTVILPGISAFVGGDILAGILACEMDQKEEITLLVDLGTNGEIVLGNRHKMMCCSTAAGPAFEGADKQFGSDLVKALAVLREQGLLDETGLLCEPYFTEGITIGGTVLTQEKIRNLQTAKAAVLSGIQLLMKVYGDLSAGEIRQVYLAGGFGYYLDPQSAVAIGLLPQELEGRILAAGNTALAGCCVYAACEENAVRAERIQDLAQSLNLARTEAFADTFLEGMYIRPVQSREEGSGCMEKMT